MGRPAMTRLARFVACECLLALPSWPWSPRSRSRRRPCTTRPVALVVPLLLGGSRRLPGGQPASSSAARSPSSACSRCVGAGARAGRACWLRRGPAARSSSVSGPRCPRSPWTPIPTTYRRTAVPYHASSIATGSSSIAATARPATAPAGCGDGPGGAGLPRPPADLTAPHAAEHTAGDMFWWLTHGIPAGGMPPFGDALSEEDRWDLINFIRALSAGEQRAQMTRPSSPTARGSSRRTPPLVVGPPRPASLKDCASARWCSSCSSRFRIRAPAGSSSPELQDAAGAGTEIDGACRWTAATQHALAARGKPADLFPVVTEGARRSREPMRSSGVALAGEHDAGSPRRHTWSSCIDRAGYLRARWIPGAGAPAGPRCPPWWPRSSSSKRETPAPPPAEHVH